MILFKNIKNTNISLEPWSYMWPYLHLNPLWGCLVWSWIRCDRSHCTQWISVLHCSSSQVSPQM